MQDDEINFGRSCDGRSFHLECRPFNKVEDEQIDCSAADVAESDEQLEEEPSIVDGLAILRLPFIWIVCENLEFANPYKNDNLKEREDRGLVPKKYSKICQVAFDCGQCSMHKYESHKEPCRFFRHLTVSIVRWSLHCYENCNQGGKLVNIRTKNNARTFDD